MSEIIISIDNHTENSITEAEAAIKEAKETLIEEATSALEATDRVALRCWKANVTFPADWKAYTTALRNIVNGTDTSSSVLPAMPTYPVGT